jgi:hypothetical protein
MLNGRLAHVKVAVQVGLECRVEMLFRQVSEIG